jgi:hypothetical protein
MVTSGIDRPPSVISGAALVKTARAQDLLRANAAALGDDAAHSAGLDVEAARGATLVDRGAVLARGFGERWACKCRLGPAVVR